MRPGVLLCVGVVLARTAPVGAATPDQVDAAVAQGVAWLYSQEHDGNWERTAAPDPNALRDYVEGGQWGGLTAAATVALLAAGESPTDPRIAAAIDFLKQHEFKGNYANAMRAQVWQYLDYEHSPEIKGYIKRDADILLNSIMTSGPQSGMYGYWDGSKGRQPESDPKEIESGTLWWDHSNSQLSVLAIWSLAETNVIEVPDAYWHLVENGWMNSQLPDGSWCYRNNDTPYTEFTKHTLNMTAAGVATLYIT
jgi:hypothetical protein